jgi:hypothetical protein
MVTISVSNSMELSPSEANRYSAIQEIPNILWNPRFHYRVNRNSQLVPNIFKIKTLKRDAIREEFNLVTVYARPQHNNPQAKLYYRTTV